MCKNGSNTEIIEGKKKREKGGTPNSTTKGREKGFGLVEPKGESCHAHRNKEGKKKGGHLPVRTLKIKKKRRKKKKRDS